MYGFAKRVKCPIKGQREALVVLQTLQRGLQTKQVAFILLLAMSKCQRLYGNNVWRARQVKFLTKRQ